MSKSKIVFIGAGRMAQALIAGMYQLNDLEITVSNNGNRKRLEKVSQTYHVKITDRWEDEVEDASMIVLAMPPEVHDPVLRKLQSLVGQQCIVTVAAGIDVDYLQSKLPSQTPVAWVMPNTAASKGESISLYAIGSAVNTDHEQLLQTMLESVGEYEKVTQQQIHQLTPITGSAPAFIYRMAQQLIAGAKDTGITEMQAQKMVAQMIKGSAAMLQTDETPISLIDQVASPGGVTAAGLEVFDQYQFDQMMIDVLQACYDRAEK